MAPPPILLNDQYLVVTNYEGSDQTWLLPPASVSNNANPLQLPLVYIGTGNLNNGGTVALVTNDDFKIDLVNPNSITNPKQTDVFVTVQLTAATNAWSTAPNARAALRTNFLSCLEVIEGLCQPNSAVRLMPEALSIITAALVQIMPFPISEVLLYACGLDSGIVTGNAPSVDVMPGMRLRCEPSLRQYVAPPNQAFSGYVASGSLAWNVVSSVASGTREQAFDAFLGTVSSPQITPPPQTTPPPSTPEPLYSLIDLQLANTGCKYHRLIYPQNVIAGSAIGNMSEQQNVQLVGANDLKTLREAPTFERIFFGRDVVIPEICILLCFKGTAIQTCYVPLGTTVNNMLERYTRWKPLAGAANDIIQLFKFGYSPPSNSSVSGSMNGVAVMFAQPVDPNTGQPAPITDFSVLDLPLCPGDALFLSFPNG
jgi:hypothetical protein